MIQVLAITNTTEIRKQIVSLRKNKQFLQFSISKNFSTLLKKVKESKVDILLLDLSSYLQVEDREGFSDDFFLEPSSFLTIILASWENPSHHDFVFTHDKDFASVFWYSDKKPFSWQPQYLAKFIKKYAVYLKKINELELIRSYNETLRNTLKVMVRRKKPAEKNFQKSFGPFFNTFIISEAFLQFVQNNPEGKLEKIFLMGEVGLQQEEIARYVHFLRFPKQSAPFMSLDFSAIQENMQEPMLLSILKDMSQLFSSSTRQEIVSTLYLSGIEKLSWNFQEKLLKILHDRFFVDENNKRITLHAFIIFSYTGDLNILVDSGMFRQDLFSHLKTYLVWLEPVRKSRKDIEPFLIKYFPSYQREHIKEVANFFLTYDCRGNVEELISVSSQLLQEKYYKEQSQLQEHEQLFSQRNFLREKFNQNFQPALFSMPPLSLKNIEKEHIHYALQYTKGNVSETSRLLGVSRKTLYSKMQNYNIKYK